jgi:hypothetical protein
MEKYSPELSIFLWKIRKNHVPTLEGNILEVMLTTYEA